MKTLNELHQILKESDAYLLRVRVALAEAADECIGEGCDEEEADDEAEEDEDEEEEE